jgi:signal transduction histidine kinase
VSTLPVVWRSHSPQQVAASLLEVLFDALHLDFAFVRLNDGTEAAYTRDGFMTERDVKVFSAALDRWLVTPAESRTPLPIAQRSSAALEVATAPIGTVQQGLLALGSVRPGFPKQTERLVWNVAANQAAVVLQQKRDQMALQQNEAVLRKKTLQLQRLAGASLAIIAAPSVDEMRRVVSEHARDIIGCRDAACSDTLGTLATHATLATLATLVVPLVGSDKEPIGVLEVANKIEGTFDDDDRALLMQLAQFAAVSIEKSRLHQAERQAREEAQQAVRFSDMFIGILGHDLRNPLSAISSAAELVLRRDKSERVAAPIARVLSSAQRMSRMIDQLLDFTRLRIGGGVPLRTAELDVKALATDLIDELRVGAADATLVLDVVGDPVVVWDRDRVGQVLSNLLANAMQHGTAGKPVHLRIDGSQAARVVIQVGNEGCIDSELLPVVFEPFRGGKRSNQRGLGLGLFIAKQLVLHHRGAIKVTSTPSTGTCFELDLPRHVPDQATLLAERPR